MFTDNQILLSELSLELPELEIVRDFRFAFVGKVQGRQKNRLVPCQSEQHIADCAGNPDVAGVVVPGELLSKVPSRLGVAASPNPVAAGWAVHEMLCDMPDFLWKDFATQVHPTATIHPTAHVAVKNVVIGEGSVVCPKAVVLERSLVGRYCSIGPGTVVGTDAFEVNIHASPRRVLRQAGGVRIGDNVEIQANCTIVRATFGGFTQLGNDTKLDCQIHVAHDCVIGNRVRIAACAELSGRVLLADDVFVGPNVSISNGLAVGEGAFVTLGAVVTTDIPPGAKYSGNFAVPHEQWLKFVKSVK